MMDILQWGLNLTFIGCFVALMIKLRGGSQTKSYLYVSSRVEKLETRLVEVEGELHKLQEAFTEKIKAVEVVLEQANRVLKNSRAGLGSFPLTQEESELKEAMYFGGEKDYIPSVSELENTKLRLQKESSMDLKTLLKGQLS